MEKLRIQATIEIFSDYELSGDLTETIAKFENIYEENKDKYDEIKIDIDSYEEYGAPSTEIKIYGLRLETDEEFQNRVKTIEYREEQKKLSELRTLRELQIKYKDELDVPEEKLYSKVPKRIND